MAELLQAMLPNDAPGVVLYALGPWVNQTRMPPIFRVRYADRKFYIENKHGTGKLGGWKPLGHASTFMAATDAMTNLNNKELKKHGLSQWPSDAASRAILARAGFAIE